MSNKNLTELVLVVDRSGSMGFIQKDAEGGIRSLLAEQSKQEGDCNVTIVQFDERVLVEFYRELLGASLDAALSAGALTSEELASMVQKGSSQS